MRALSLFSGIGGLDLAAIRAGIEVVAMCEIEPYAQRVLRKRFPDIPIIDDVRKINKKLLIEMGVIDSEGNGRTIDIISGGFP